MSKIIKLGIAKNSNQKIEEVSKIELLAGKGIIGDRHFHENNSIRSQITLIESENIDYYNNKFKTNYSYLDFRRNVITKGTLKLFETINCRVQFFSIFCHLDLYFHLILIFPLKFRIFSLNSISLLK